MKNLPKTVKILGKRYKLKFVPNLGENLGDCDHPKEKGKTIRIKMGLNDLELLDVLLHEFIHIADFHRNSEEYVTELATDLAKTLYRLGYRKQ